MNETIKNYVNVCIKKGNQVLLLNRQHDDFKGWIQPGGKVEFPESFFEAAVREVKEETGLTVRHLQLKGISGFTNPTGKERYVYYDFLCEDFEGEILTTSPEGTPKWWAIGQLDQLDMQDDIRDRLLLYWRRGSFERIHYWDEENHCISHTEEILYD
ncbi:DNA mismatch repair protein MutT [Streptococcus azizii]|uniref:DNA mismatch repair protein MutT n=1 Tax=Streptococcus azizii TaxID=1579424 RepID=A0AB36JLU5_9STRE|nr:MULTISPECIES: 8-oxo-dGTP diphosphatase [Streptococcus]MBF0776913.1 8-oxo-dGTP diphosphatase [Streptococcus sp. 19428wD3_AN2]ONK25521.1 DNA mismatch repair protein MutT [Streptococcus azizii]ONK25818.1 DNA mismatch repair protein MutT [Streptococcus azizii]ONK27202.1 DNA mismatch repair protein MutT [Streptococcus azizii]TFU82127.1 8-oxo-dGTP diphosphatase [Streptococcus sp. AN2]